MSDAEEPAECLPLDDVALVRPLLDEFKSAKRGERKNVVRKAVTAVMAARDTSHLRPLAHGKVIARVKEQIKTWLHNHGRSRTSKDVIKYVRRWNIQQVVGALHHKDIEQLCREHSQAVPGEKSYLKSYQKVLKTYTEGLPEDQQTRYQEMANEWSDRSPPPEIQRRMAELHGPKYIKQFAHVMWRQCGMRLIVLEAHKDTKTELCIASHDFNREMGGEAFSDVRPAWQTESIMDEWAHYAQSQMTPSTQDGSALPTRRRNKKVLVEFERDDNDAPIVSDPSQMMARDMEPMVRQFMSIHYKKVSGGKKAVDWAALSENQDDMIDPKYLPADFVFRDPSKMKKTHYQALLEHWYGRQEDDDTETVFTFKGYWDPSRDSVMVANDKHPAHQKRSKPLAEKRQPGPRSIGSKPKRTNSKAAREANKPPKRNGPPGIRKGDEQWPVDSDSEDGDDDEDGEDDDEDDEGDEEAEPLPFSAPLRRGAPGIAKKARLPEPKAKARSNAGANSSKSKHPDQTSKTDKPEPRFTKRVLPRPAYRGIPSDAAASQMSPTAPKPVKEKPPRKPAPQYERPTTRSGAKRKVDDAELQAIGEPSKKKGKNNAVTKGGSKGKIFPKQK